VSHLGKKIHTSPEKRLLSLPLCPAVSGRRGEGS
jgi:hypothetical protein